MGLISFFLLFSCKKEATTSKPLQVETYSHISITDASPGSPNMSFFIDNQHIDLPDSLYYGNTIFTTILDSSYPNNPIRYTLPYLTIQSGYHQLSFGQVGMNGYLVNLNSYFKSGGNYSVFVVDTLQHGQLKYVLLDDNLIPPDSSKCQIRFVNLSADAPGMDIWAFPDAGVNGFKIFSDQSYPLYSYNNILNSEAFTTLKAGPYYFIATVAGTNHILLEGGLKLPGRSVVTIYAKGLLSSSNDQKLDVGVILYTWKRI